MSASDVVSAEDVDLTDVLVSNTAESRSHLEAGDLESAYSGLTQRLMAALSALMVDFDGAEKDPWILLDILLGRLNRSGRADEAWLIFIALTTVLPRVADVEAFLREATSSSVAQTRLWLFAFTLPIIRERGTMNLLMRVVQDATVIDVNFSATDEHNTGIQRVVRRTLPSWLRDHAVELAAWTSYSGALRTLTPREFHRAVEWDEVREGDKDASNVELLVPWRTRLILAEVPSRSSMCDPLGALARFSGNSVSLIGYDAIPIVSAESVPAGMSDHFAKFLGVVKWSESVAAISAAAAGEFRGFAAMLGSQGLVGPRVVECSLPA
ncbi:MAG: hypothetical protein H7201_06690, partial [Candidatus Saccharibacteria bacterium]|nr:hypothetical protein [Microbacteriaceae bacterium]